VASRTQSPLTGTSLNATERRVLERLLALLESELGDDLLAVWLYGSRARGEPRREYSDVDLLILTREGQSADYERVQRLVNVAAEAEGLKPFSFSAMVSDRGWLASQRAIDAFFLQEVDRDRVVLMGEEFVGEGLHPTHGTAADRAARVKARTEEYMDDARESLEAAGDLMLTRKPARAVHLAYYAMFHAVGGALSERDLHARPHQPLWDLFLTEFVEAGEFPRALYDAAQNAKGMRIDTDYGGGRPDSEMVQALIERAQGFVSEVEAILARARGS